MNKTYKFLPWDTRFFGYKIAFLKSNNIESNALQIILNKLKSEQFKLIYWYVAPDDTVSNDSAKIIGAKLVDEKITYIKNISNYSSSPKIPLNIYSINTSFQNNKLKSLALQSGEFSRFRIDNNFKNNEFEKLYTTWIEKSIKRIIAKDVLVYKKHNNISGLITIGIKNKRGNIGLVAVDKNARGKSIGEKIMHSAISKFIEWNLKYIQVVTQKANKIGCKFYESFGFEIEKIENIYHIWL